MSNFGEWNWGESFYESTGTLPYGPNTTMMEFAGAQAAQQRAQGATTEPVQSYRQPKPRINYSGESTHDFVARKIAEGDAKFRRWLIGQDLFHKCIRSEIGREGSERSRQAAWDAFIRKGYKPSEFGTDPLSAQYMAIYEERGRRFSRERQAEQQRARDAAAWELRKKALEPTRLKMNALLAKERKGEGTARSRQAEWDKLLANADAQFLLNLPCNKELAGNKVFVERGKRYKLLKVEADKLIEQGRQKAINIKRITAGRGKSSLPSPCSAVLGLHALGRLQKPTHPSIQFVRLITDHHNPKPGSPCPAVLNLHAWDQSQNPLSEPGRPAAQPARVVNAQHHR